MSCGCQTALFVGNRWTLTTLRDKLIEIGAKMVRHARYITFQLAEVAVPRRLYRTILNRIRRFAAITPRAAPIGPGALTDNLTNECGAALSVRACLLKDTADPAVENANPLARGRFRLGGRIVAWARLAKQVQ